MNQLRPFEVEAIADLRRALDADRVYEIKRLRVERDDLLWMMAHQKNPHNNLVSIRGNGGLNVVVDHDGD